MASDHSIHPFPSDVNRDAFGHWLSGFTDGEGSFQLRIGFRASRGVYDMGGAFIIGLRADDLSILERIREFFGCGHAYVARGHNRRGNTKPSAHFKIYRATDLMHAVIPHFLRYPLRAKKARDFILWKEGVELLHHVYQRKTVTRGYLQGTMPRWSQEELARFQWITATLRNQRLYSPPDITAPPAAFPGDYPLFAD